MEKPEISSGSRELQCVGRLEVVRPKPVGFLCGSIPVPTDKAFHAFNSALVPSSQNVKAPQYRMLPTETDLNTLPLLSNIPEKVLPVGFVHSKTRGDFPWESKTVTSNLSRKCEALAVSGLVEYGDEIDVIAPSDILKQIFKMPYSKGRLSIAVHRIGKTLVLNTGPDVEEGEKLVRRHGNQSKCADQSLLLNFAMHSVRMEACDCPPTHNAPLKEQSNSSVVSEPANYSVQRDTSQFPGRSNDCAQDEGFNHHNSHPQVKKDSYVWESKRNMTNKGRHVVPKVSQVGEKKPNCSVQESERRYRRAGNDEFLRVLFWQFHNFRMLLGSDLLLFSNEKYVSVSLHLWDITRQVTPLTWLEAWLDNIMASIPELAICYHQNGVIQGYELLKTDDIFLLKGISEDGTPAFNPHVVQQNGLSVLRFLKQNCKQDPGAYWLYKSSGEDAIQLFDLSVIPKSHSSNDCDDSPSSLPSLMHRGRSDSLFSLGTLLYRIAHRLSLSMTQNDKARCVRFFRKCFDFLDEPDHLVVRAVAHEQFARLLLNYDDDLDLITESLPVESEHTVTDAEDESLDVFSSISESIVHENVSPLVTKDKSSQFENKVEDSMSENSGLTALKANVPASEKVMESGVTDMRDSGVDESLAMCNISPTSSKVVQAVSDPISSKLAAIHHVSQAIKSLRWKRQLQSLEPELVHDRPSPPTMNVSLCTCGDADCIEVCDIKEWLPTSKLDDKLWKLVLLLGESYLALGQAYKEDNQLNQALKVVELACSVYGSMPQQLNDTSFISSMTKFNGKTQSPNSGSNDSCLDYDRFSSTFLFWAKAWTLVGDVYVEFHMIKGKEISLQAEKKTSSKECRISSDVVKELKRLKKKLGQYKQNCSSCSLVNCSCQSDRANSNSSASSSSGHTRSLTYGRKQTKRSHAKGSSFSLLEIPEDEHIIPRKVEYLRSCENKSEDTLTDKSKVKILPETDNKRVEGSTEMPKAKNGGIFKYLGGPVIGDADCNLSAALSCYEEAKKALPGFPINSSELQSVVKKKGWVCNELGRIRLKKKDLEKAELAFSDAIGAFKEVSDHVNVILINCNLGHGRRALAEEFVSQIENLGKHVLFEKAYNQLLERARIEYRESLKYYGAAKSELNAIKESNLVPNDLKNEVFTQFAHTYLRLGMLLAREDTVTEVYMTASEGRTKKELQKHEISANDAIREALSLYESLGELRKQEAAYAYFQLACYQRDCCLKFLDSGHKKSSLSKGENSNLHRAKQYASLAERNWQKALDFYGPKTHSNMYLTILLERSALSLSLSNAFQPNAMLESALSRMLEGHHVCGETFSDTDIAEVYDPFWSHLQTVLKRMLAFALSNTNKSSLSYQPISCNKSEDVEKLKALYKISLQARDLSRLHAMQQLWTC